MIPAVLLNLRIRVGEAIGEAMLQHKLCSRAELYDKVIAVMQICGFAPHHYNRFPHEFSAVSASVLVLPLILNPDFIIADEYLGAGCAPIRADHQLFSISAATILASPLLIPYDLAVEHLSMTWR